MAVTAIYYNAFKSRVLNGPLIDSDSDTLKLALVLDTYTPNIDTHDFWDDVSANEVANGAGYTTGGVTIASPVVGFDTTGDFGYLDADDPGWVALTKTFRYAVLYKSTGVSSTSPLIVYFDFATNQTITGVNFNLNIPAAASGGLLKVA